MFCLHCPSYPQPLWITESHMQMGTSACGGTEFQERSPLSKIDSPIDVLFSLTLAGERRIKTVEQACHRHAVLQLIKKIMISRNGKNSGPKILCWTRNVLLASKQAGKLFHPPP
ncbi:hypothetical protein ABW19_dt0201544 [Dactylella cylindrospora]|nr:hypothetical protein ABW19_dt0201544 [Dactylella cylindrospora]